MDSAESIVTAIVSETDRWLAMMGLIGVIVGALIAAGGTILAYWLQSRPKRRLDAQRSTLLTAMLKDTRFPKRWRKLSTIARVIGASERTTTRLLIGLGARGSEVEDGLWGLIEYHPLDNVGQ